MLPALLVLGLAVGVQPVVPRESAATATPTASQGYLPADGAVRWIRENPGDGVWQVTAARREAPKAYAMVSLRARTQLAELGRSQDTAGQWLVIDALRPDVAGALVTFSYDLTPTGPALVAVESSQSWSVFQPGLPMLDDRLLAGQTVSWQGGMSISGDRGMPSYTGEATAEVNAETVDGRPECRRVVATITVSGSVSRTGTTWCSGDEPGWAGSSDGNGYGFDIAADRPASAPDLSANPAPAALAGRSRKVRTFRGVGGVLLEYVTPTASQLMRVRDRVVLVDINGDMEGWAPLEEQDPAYSDYYLAWRARPGSAVRAIAQQGDLVFVGTTAGRLLAYDFAGRVVWETQLEDAAVNVQPWGDHVLVTDADGGVQILDGATGAESWSTERDNLIGAPMLTTQPAPGLLGLQTPFGIEVIDIETLRSWTARVDERGSQAGLTSGLLVVRQGNWLVARDAATGTERWTLLIPPRTRMAIAPNSLVLSSPDVVTGLAPDGSIRWTAPPTGSVLTGNAGTLLVYSNGLLFQGADGATRWTFAADLRAPVTGSIALTARGVIVLHRDASFGTQWWEYA